jgi:hypothetical protein
MPTLTHRERPEGTRADKECTGEVRVGSGPPVSSTICPPAPALVDWLRGHLARLEVRIVIEELLERLPDYEVVGEPTPHIRGGATLALDGLRIRFPSVA